MSERYTEAYDAGHRGVVPEYMMPGLKRYIEHGVPPGDFWQAVLRNDLRGACERADDHNIRNLGAYMVFLYNAAPAACWGSPEKYEAWLARFLPRTGAQEA